MTRNHARSRIGLLVLLIATVLVLESGVALALPKAALCPCDTWECGGGISGGGTIRTNTGTATFSIFAMQIPPPSDKFAAADIGRVHWTTRNDDGTTVIFVSVTVDDYGWTGQPEAGVRWLRGVMSVNGEQQAPFFMKAVDNGQTDAGADTIELFIGSAIEGATDQGYGFHATGALATGDLQLMEDVPLETMAPDDV